MHLDKHNYGALSLVLVMAPSSSSTADTPVNLIFELSDFSLQFLGTFATCVLMRTPLKHVEVCQKIKRLDEGVTHSSVRYN